MKYTHHSSQPFKYKASRIYDQKLDMKPKGLWLSVDDDWRRWCVSEEFHLKGLDVTCNVTIDESKVLTLTDAEAIDMFTLEYGKNPYAESDYLLFIDWPRVAAKYAGIVIAPYCWDRRLVHSWYYGWDCASGCIWDLSAITQFDADMTTVLATAMSKALEG